LLKNSTDIYWYFQNMSEVTIFPQVFNVTSDIFWKYQYISVLFFHKPYSENSFKIIFYIFLWNLSIYSYLFQCEISWKWSHNIIMIYCVNILEKLFCLILQFFLFILVHYNHFLSSVFSIIKSWFYQEYFVKLSNISIKYLYYFIAHENNVLCWKYS
jgi:hypothetical protein